MSSENLWGNLCLKKEIKVKIIGEPHPCQKGPEVPSALMVKDYLL